MLLIVSSILFSSCRMVDYFTKQSGNEYRNAITEKLNTLTPIVEYTLTAYDEAIPDTVTEESTIDLEKLNSAALDLTNGTQNITQALLEESYDTALQTTVREKLNTEQTALESYQKTYTAMVTFYKDGAYKTVLADVETHNNAIKENYDALVEAHNATVDALGLVKEF